MPASWDAIAARLEELAKTDDDEFRLAVERLQLAVRAQTKPYTLDVARAILARLEQRNPAGDASAGASAPTFEYEQFSTQEQYNIGQVVLNTGAAAAPEEPQSVPVSVVVVAMGRGEAEALVAGDAFDSLPAQLREHFDQLHALLVDEGLDDWLDRYGTAATDWRPFAATGQTVDALVRTTFDVVNATERYTPVIEPDVVDLGAVADDRLRLRLLRRRCLVIIDSLSMRHPRVQASFHRSLLDAYPTTAVIAIAPIQRAFEAGRELSVYVPMRLADLEYARRQADPDEEYGACSETADGNQFDQWLRSRIKTMSVDLEVRSGILRHMRVGQR